MHLRSQGVVSGSPDAPYTAQILRCTRHREEVQHEWSAPTLEAAQQQADEWLTEWGVRVELQNDSSQRVAEARRQRMTGIDGMPQLPPLKPKEAEVAAKVEEWELEDAQDPPSAAEKPKERYATKAEIVRAIAAARAAGLQVAEIHIKRDGTIAILSKEATEGRGRTSVYDKWKQGDASRR